MNERAITTAHLEKTAFVYLRQSSPTQVKRNVESGRRQRGMVERVKLPHSNLTFQYSTRVWERARPGAGGAQRPIEPDVRIVPTLEDHLRGRDPVWDYFVATYAKPR